MVRIGIVCEGPTDAHAIEKFLGASLKDQGITPAFVHIQPEKDKTRPGGWSAVLKWLLKNPPKLRIKKHLGARSGLFAGGLSAKQCDVLVFHLDADILGCRSFQRWTKKWLSYDVTESSDPIRRGKEIRAIIGIAGEFGTLSDDQLKRHIPAPAVESTETWCVAAFGASYRACKLIVVVLHAIWSKMSGDPERLSGANLCRKFMTVLHRSERCPIQPPFAHINKNVRRRRNFCARHSSGFWRVETQCRHYRELVASVTSQVKSI